MWINDAVAVKPYKFDKTGYGAMAAWMCVGSIHKVKA